MELDALRSAKFDLLDDAVSDWTKVVGNLEKLEEEARTGLRGKAEKADWKGVNATVSRQFIGKTAGEFSDARTQATSIRNILRDTRDELKVFQGKLNDALERARSKNLTVTSTGDGGFTVTKIVHPDRAAPGTKVPENTPDDTLAVRDEIQTVLNGAAESDSTAARVLRALVDRTDVGFSAAAYADRDSGADALKAADEAAQILKKNPHDVTNEELTRLNSTLARYSNDPLFAERFAIEAGPKRTLEFYAGIADPAQGMRYDPKRGEQAKQLQKNLGITLGTATLSSSSAMKNWEWRMVEMGKDPLGVDDANDPRGFAVMSNLMRFGDYDDEFLNHYGNSLIAFDKENNAKDLSPWINNWNQGDLNYWGKNDRGRDPMTGFLEALGHNPGAATDFFAQPVSAEGRVDKASEVNDNLAYLAKERNWLSDAPIVDGDSKVVAGRNALGHALEAATTGYAYDAIPTTEKGVPPQIGDLRTAETADVMEQVAYLYGGEDGPKMLHGSPEMVDSLGKMGAAYIDDLNYHLSGIGDGAKDTAGFPEKYEGRANFGEQGAIDFLSVLGQHETSHSVVTSAQHLYTLSMLDAHPATSDTNIDTARDAISAEAEARGILDNARVRQAELTYGANSEAANASLGRSAEWGKFAVGAVVGIGVAAIPVPGSAGAAIAIAPLAAETVGGAVSTFLGQQIDKGTEGSQQDPGEQAQMTSREFYSEGANSIAQGYEAYLNANPSVREQADQENWKEDFEAGYLGTGSHQNEFRGRPAYKG
ncbi:MULTISPECIES: DUF6571 family protein [Streptomyces]|uniref:AG2 protein n=1 Tax=Streptomyces tsukubensis (strain DSM 42081 / NBRC 108919 / NRRL 18488 / 9993) TaxID=1114943 RepID=I2N7C3_STRT9|nr:MULTISPECIES: DUF6571 family protein [Streptomyces]AZK96850.1 hypothetical protein B7R87_25490 [Streptomyces tsukubensis]EIF92920.1 hypothetical protein [Streptomyces tsukubensis NRRL18488]MYS64627.1 hypothetical protein [Streptomyces sp. SID5473]QKM67163.1 hypothetical protein STSU_008280 [Streptomyces tsukubensis NRRL18488]TAI41866.1 hypothetical protein EWI31_23130 [Streptomyces tsukubensis]